MKGSTFFISILDDQMSTRKAGEEILKVSAVKISEGGGSMIQAVAM